MRTTAMDALRTAIKVASTKQNAVVTVPQLAKILGVAGESQMQLLRRRMVDLVHQGEMQKIAQGQWQPTGKEPTRKGESYQRMWRAIRSARATFTIIEIVQISQVDNSTVSKYLKYLESETLVRRAGKRKNTLVYGLTSKGQEHRKTPFPPIDIPDPFHIERTAVATLCNAFLVKNISQPTVQQEIIEQLTILTSRFMQPEKKEAL